MIYNFKARDRKGAMVAGEAEAESVSALQEELFGRGFIPIQVKEKNKGAFSVEEFVANFNRATTEEVMIFTRQFYTLFKAGVSIDTILATLSKQALGKAMTDAIERIRADVNSGMSLAKAFRQHPKVFNELYVSMVSAGEEAGILEQTLEELVKLIEKDEAIKKNIKSATLYPKIVMFVLVGAVGVLMTFVIPKFEQFYGHYGAELPMATRILMASSNFVREFWWIVILICVGVTFLYKRFAATRSGRYKLDQLRFMYPVFGMLNLKVANSRFAHILSSLYRSGMSMSRSLEIVAHVIDNEAFGMEVRKIADDITRGSGLAASMQQRKYFPVIVIEITSVGERAGSLDEMLHAVAEHFELEVAHTIKNLTTLLEPLMLIFIFGLVTLMALAIFLPIWNMSSIVLGK